MKKLPLKPKLNGSAEERDKAVTVMYEHMVAQQAMIEQLINNEKRSVALLKQHQATIRTLKAKLHTIDLEVNSLRNSLRKYV